MASDFRDVGVSPVDVESSVTEVAHHDNNILPNVDNQCRRQPKRILHFSDGTLEEYSTDEDDESENEKRDCADSKALVDPSTFTWLPFLWYHVVNAGNKTLAACDYVGEHLASFFGITTPKYQFEIDEYYKMKAEEEEEKQKELAEMAGWSDSHQLSTVDTPCTTEFSLHSNTADLAPQQDDCKPSAGRSMMSQEEILSNLRAMAEEVFLEMNSTDDTFGEE